MALPISKVELFVSCRDLKNMDLLSKSDPIVALFVPVDPRAKSKQWREVGRTEQIRNNLNPDFAKSFNLDYCFEQVQPLRFCVYDVDNASSTLSDDDFIGESLCTLSEIVASKGQTLRLPITSANGSNKRGEMIIKAEEVSACLDQVILHFEAQGLAKKDGLFGKSDPFLVISRCNEDNSYTVVHKTEVVMKNLNPTWQRFTIPVAKLCNNDYMRPLRIECYDWDKDGSHDFIGEFHASLHELLSGVKSFKLIDVTAKKPKETGTITLREASVQKEYSFLEYISGGCEISMIVSVDFTGSNGDPRTPSSLHYCGNPAAMNYYECAIRGVGEVLAYYDSDKMFPAYGYGAKLPDGTVSHCFALNGNPQQPECAGIEGVVAAYKQALNNVQLYGPTLFSPTIRMASEIVRHSMAMSSPQGAHQKYFILLLITDGIITDMKETIESIVAASSLPLSIVIVGVGQEDFSAMNFLDADNNRLHANGVYAERDIVQFVPYRDYIASGYAKLAEDTLRELPRQFLDYMKKHGIKPMPKVIYQQQQQQQQQQQM